ncbi:MAG TPA: hypothetical protein VJA21_04630, partial [Verrucomicrobiae bacterium]
MKALIATAVLLSLSPASSSLAAETVGKRPYELEWANRTQDHCAPLVDFEDLTGWRVEATLRLD